MICNEKIKIFESDNIVEFLKENQLELLGELPMSKDVANIAANNNQILDKEIKANFENTCKKIVEKLN